MIDYENLLNIVKTENDLEDFLTEHDEWDYLYNLSNIRKNVLEWYDFREDARLLEIGAECGAVTGLFCERVSEVVSFDSDERKCEINRERNKSYSNLKVISSTENLEKAIIGNPLEEEGDNNDESVETIKFDYVVIIADVSDASLNLASKMLKQDGILIIVAANRFGIKYFAGASDVGEIKRLGRKKLIDMLIRHFFTDMTFYYPIPDYVFTTEIFSENNLPKRGDIKSESPDFTDGTIRVFDEVKAIDDICDDGDFEEFANSFIVVCKN